MLGKLSFGDSVHSSPKDTFFAKSSDLFQNFPRVAVSLAAIVRHIYSLIRYFSYRIGAIPHREFPPRDGSSMTWCLESIQSHDGSMGGRGGSSIHLTMKKSIIHGYGKYTSHMDPIRIIHWCVGGPVVWDSRRFSILSIDIR